MESNNKCVRCLAGKENSTLSRLVARSLYCVVTHQPVGFAACGLKRSVQLDVLTSSVQWKFFAPSYSTVKVASNLRISVRRNAERRVGGTEQSFTPHKLLPKHAGMEFVPHKSTGQMNSSRRSVRRSRQAASHRKSDHKCTHRQHCYRPPLRGPLNPVPCFGNERD